MRRGVDAGRSGRRMLRVCPPGAEARVAFKRNARHSVTPTNCPGRNEALFDALSQPGELETVWAQVFHLVAPFFWAIYFIYCRNYMLVLQTPLVQGEQDGFAEFRVGLAAVED